MTKRERMMLALSNKTPDRVPCAPDISNMVPCRLTGRNFQEIYVRSNPPLWKAYLDAVRYYDIDGWFCYGEIDYKSENVCTAGSKIYSENGNEIIWTVIHTPKGDINQKVCCYPGNPPTIVEKYIKDFKEDFEKIKYLFPRVTGYDDTVYRQQVKELGEDGIMAVGLFPPGFQVFLNYFQGNLEAMTYAYYDEPALFDELIEIYVKNMEDQLEIIAEIKPDSVLTGGSGSITLQSNELFDKMCLPHLKKISKVCSEAGIISGVHSCGKEEYLIKQCALHTGINYVNPLEIPPMGDCGLFDIKQKYGGKLALMGNLHTTNVMLRGSVKDVRQSSLQAILDAGEGGGFVLSTGDQCGRDTPDENIREMVKVCKEFGNYPLDKGGINEELSKLRNK